MPLDQKKIGKAITHLRKQAGFTQKGLADRLFISDKAVSKWERGISVPDIAYLGKLSVLLDTDIDTLLEGKHVSRDNRWKGFLITDDYCAEVSLLTSIYDKPLVYYLLSNFLLVGIHEVLIACSRREAAQLQTLLGTGENLGIRLCYTEKESRSDICGIIGKNREFFRDCDVMTVFEKSVLYGASLTYLFQRAMLNRGQHTLIAVPAVGPAGEKQICFDDTKRVAQSGTISTKYDYCCIPVLFSPGDLLMRDVSEGMALSSLVDELAEKGSLFVENANRGIVEVTVASADDVLDASSLIRILQKRSGTYVACLEEIAWRRGLINNKQLRVAQQAHRDTQYGNYLLRLSRENYIQGESDGEETDTDSER